MSGETFVPYVQIPKTIIDIDGIGYMGMLYCGLISGLSSGGACTASNLYFARFFTPGFDALDPEDQQKKISASKRKINRLIQMGIVKNIGSGSERKLLLTVSDEAGHDVPLEPESGTLSPTKRDIKSRLLTLLYKKVYILSNVSIGQDKDLDNVSKKEMIDYLFGYFWEHYPRREKKKTSYQRFAKLPVSKMEALLDRLPAIARHYADRERRYIPLPSSFINDERWDDEIFQKEEKNPQKGAAARSEDSGDPDIETVVWRAKARGDGDEVATDEMELAMLASVGMTVEDAVDLVEYETTAALRERLSSARECAA